MACALQFEAGCDMRRRRQRAAQRSEPLLWYQIPPLWSVADPSTRGENLKAVPGSRLSGFLRCRVCRRLGRSRQGAGGVKRRRWRRQRAAPRLAMRCKCRAARLWREKALARALQSQANRSLPAAMSDRPSLGKTEEQKSLRELSVALTSFAESQSQIKCIFSLYDHDSDGFLTTDQTTLLMRKLGYGMPSAWAYVYRDAVTLPLVSNMPHARASLPAPFDARFAGVAVCTRAVARKAKGAKDVQSAFARHRPILRHEL